MLIFQQLFCVSYYSRLQSSRWYKLHHLVFVSDVYRTSSFIDCVSNFRTDFGIQRMKLLQLHSASRSGTDKSPFIDNRGCLHVHVVITLHEILVGPLLHVVRHGRIPVG